MENAKTNSLLPHQQRVVEERIELIDKITKLHSFFKTSTFADLNEENQNLLDEQSQIMMKYSDILLKRINKF
jgi:uncharacterized protein YjgD (DUF1641 family)